MRFWSEWMLVEMGARWVAEALEKRRGFLRTLGPIPATPTKLHSHFGPELSGWGGNPEANATFATHDQLSTKLLIASIS